MQIEVFLNQDPRNSMYHGYRKQDSLLLAASYEVACPGEAAKPVDDVVLLEDAFERFNIGEDAIAQEYRCNGHRSLSKGDVVVLVDGDQRRAYSCDSFGWTLLDHPLKELRTPEQWQEVTGWRIVDPDGWATKGWTDPITLGEFEIRARISTAEPPAEVH